LPILDLDRSAVAEETDIFASISMPRSTTPTRSSESGGAMMANSTAAMPSMLQKNEANRRQERKGIAFPSIRWH
jgi:hypothetical protein